MIIHHATCSITKNTIPGESLSQGKVLAESCAVTGVKAARVTGGREGMMAFQKGRLRGRGGACEWQTLRWEQMLHCPFSP